VTVLHQERWAQHLDGGLNRWGIMTSNDSESLKQRVQDRQITFGMCYLENTWHKYVEWFYKRREIIAVWEAQNLIFSHKVTELIKYHGHKGRTYDVVPLDWGIKNYNVYNRNGLIEMVIFYTYIIFYLTLKFKQ
jgi:hypothetical protein